MVHHMLSSEGKRVDAASLKKLLPAPSTEVQVYVCGPGDMTKAVCGGKGKIAIASYMLQFPRTSHTYTPPTHTHTQTYQHLPTPTNTYPHLPTPTHADPRRPTPMHKHNTVQHNIQQTHTTDTH